MCATRDQVLGGTARQGAPGDKGESAGILKLANKKGLFCRR